MIFLRLLELYVVHLLLICRPNLKVTCRCRTALILPNDYNCTSVLVHDPEATVNHVSP